MDLRLLVDLACRSPLKIRREGARFSVLQSPSESLFSLASGDTLYLTISYLTISLGRYFVTLELGLGIDSMDCLALLSGEENGSRRVELGCSS